MIDLFRRRTGEVLHPDESSAGAEMIAIPDLQTALLDLLHGAPRASLWSPKTVPTYAKASVGHPPMSEIRRSL